MKTSSYKVGDKIFIFKTKTLKTVTMYAWVSSTLNTYCYTISETPAVGDAVYVAGSPLVKGTVVSLSDDVLSISATTGTADDYSRYSDGDL